MPASCPQCNSKWKPSETMWHCRQQGKKKQCNKKRSWRQATPLAQLCSNSFTPGKFVEALYWFSQQESVGKVAQWLGMKRQHVIELFYQIRCCLAQHLTLHGTHLIGGPGRVAVIDETFVVQRKRIAGIGQHGRVTAGHRTLILACAELDLGTRRLTGRAWMRCIDSRDRATLEAIIRATVRPGTEVWTDSFASYDWLTEAGYNHKRVNHSTGQFVAEDGSGTNSIEGLFMRTKKLLRGHHVRIPKNKNYGAYLAEFLWRQKHLGCGTVPPREDFPRVSLSFGG